MSMSALAGMYFVNSSGTRDEEEPEENNGHNSDDGDESCSNSETASEACIVNRKLHNESPPTESSGSSRRNKRKNFMPRNIVEYEGSDEEEEGHGGRARVKSSDDENNDSGDECEIPLDLSESEVKPYPSHLFPAPPKYPTSPHSQLLNFSPMDLRLSALAAGLHSFYAPQMNGGSNGGYPAPNQTGNVLTDFAESTMKELIGLYGLGGGGKMSSIDIPTTRHHPLLPTTNDSSSSNKMMLPENMARFLAAMQESASHHSPTNNNSIHLGSPPTSPNQSQSEHSSSFLNQSELSSNFLNQSELSSSFLNQSERTRAEFMAQSERNADFLGQSDQNPGFLNLGDFSSKRGSFKLSSLNNNNAGEGNSESSNGNPQTQPRSRAKGRGSGGRGLNSFPVIREGLLGKGSGPVDYTRYVRRFGSFSECGHGTCRELNYREHFHCLECMSGSRIFIKKEEMIRHFKWHKKRDESLQHGFMRYSPSDDCGDRFRSCPHNRKQTHYHCLKSPCAKVYISTSDVQMHANYHRKDSAIISEGFQRFRAAEDCGLEICSFRHQRTTHFHCRRSTCSYTFKNKADMEKHKSYHVKDEQLNRDGFKKFMKHEACHYSTCRFSRVCNHIHCIRDGCNYVLHSSGQLYSHKRKHERRDSELAYRKFKLAQRVRRGTLGAEFFGDNFRFDDDSLSSLNDEGGEGGGGEGEEKKYAHVCKCDQSPGEHYHCRAESCANYLLTNSDLAGEHIRTHELEERISSLAYFTVDPSKFDAHDSTIPCVSEKCTYQYREKHHHCLWDGCSEIILAVEDEPFKRLEHFRHHEKNSKLELPNEPMEKLMSPEPNDGFFKRKRGRPPKNRVIEVSSGGCNEAIFTSFKLPKHLPPDSSSDTELPKTNKPIGFSTHSPSSPCKIKNCNLANSTHYHCSHPRCWFKTEESGRMGTHSTQFHSHVHILDGFEYFDKGSPCHYPNCEYKMVHKSHFHCSRDEFSFIKYASMEAHESENHEVGLDSGASSSSSGEEDPDSDWDSGKKERKRERNHSDSVPTSDWSQKSLRSSDWLKSSDKKSSKSLLDSDWSKKEQRELDASLFKEEPNSYDSDSKNIGKNESNPMDLSGNETIGKGVTDHSLSRILQLENSESSETAFGPLNACGRAFCKLKRKPHFHCHICNQAFSELDKLRPHVLKHSSLATSAKNHSSLPPDAENDENNSSNSSFDDEVEESAHSLHSNAKIKEKSKDKVKEEIVPSSSLNASSLASNYNFSPNFLYAPPPTSPYLLFQQNQLSSLYANMFSGTTGLPSSPPLPISPSALKRPSPSSTPPSPPDSKKQRVQIRIMKDEPVPPGYVRFRFNEDCVFEHCGYREHQTHFHCTREDCGYSFCDKTRFVQHTARHERLDTLMGGDFKQYRANVSCGRAACSYIPTVGTSQGQNKASHFHCCKCEFVCTDTNKVVAHRRQHQKLDSIIAAGFEKFTPSQQCHSDGCIHAQKQTHYHCLKCAYAVLGLSQMSAHKYRHSE